MRMTHALTMGDAADAGLADKGVNLVITSPLYPIVEVWDDLFSVRDDTVGVAPDTGNGDAAFEAMHEQLDAVWGEATHVLTPGGAACVNIGDTAQSLGGSFRQHPSHARVPAAPGERGLTPLPDAV